MPRIAQRRRGARAAHASRANRRRREIPSLPHHPLVREGNLCETRTPRPVRHRGKHEVFDENTEKGGTISRIS